MTINYANRICGNFPNLSTPASYHLTCRYLVSKRGKQKALPELGKLLATSSKRYLGDSNKKGRDILLCYNKSYVLFYRLHPQFH